MSWARIDDGFYSHPKTMRAWRRCPSAVGLFVLALSWAAQQEQDGSVPPEVIGMWMPDQRDRDQATDVLTAVGLWHENGDGFVIHDYLDYNPSRADVTERRRVDRDRKRVKR